jgi:hypothetical protein
MGLPVIANAMCYDGRAPDVRAEFLHAPLVVQARVVKVKDLQEDASDSYGVTASEYSLVVKRRLKGKDKRSQLVLRSENTSSRFPMEMGENYLLFLTSDTEHPGQYYVDSCGNSAPMASSKAALQIMENMNAVKGK